MRRYWRLCAKTIIAFCCVVAFLSCDSEAPTPQQRVQLTANILKQLDHSAVSDWDTDKIKLLQKQVEEESAMSILAGWALQHPQRFGVLLKHITDTTFQQNFARQTIVLGKSFVFMERFSATEDKRIIPILESIEQIEQEDHRRKVLSRELTLSSPLQRIAKLEGEVNGIYWDGAALLVAQSDCKLGFATAGHNVTGMDGMIRAPLSNITISMGGVKHALVEVLPVHSPSLPENDWALVITDKVRCGKNYTESMLELEVDWELSEQGLKVGLYCFHEGETDVMPSLYQEQCLVYPTDAGVLDYYADKPPGQLGIHTCLSQPGSSGCPILLQENHKTYFVGIQIERDANNGAGIVRLFSGEFARALEQLRARFARENLALQ